MFGVADLIASNTLNVEICNHEIKEIEHPTWIASKPHGTVVECKVWAATNRHLGMSTALSNHGRSLLFNRLSQNSISP